jgi:hypothetical protein
MDAGSPTPACIPITPEVGLSFLGGGGHGFLDRTMALPAGETTTMTLVIENSSGADVDLEVTFDAPWPVDSVKRPYGFDEGLYAFAEWNLTVPEPASGDHTVTASVTASYQCEVGSKEHTTTLDQPVEVSPVLFAPYGFNAGGWYGVNSGEGDGVEWARIDGLSFDNGTEGGGGTQYVSVSGSANASPTETAVDDARWDADIVTVDGDHHGDDILAPLYQTAHFGGNLGYDVAIENGTYDVTLYFAENNEEIGPGDRLFDVSVQGTTRLEAFDVAAQNEFLHAPVVRTFEGIDVTDGTLSISTESIEGDSFVNGFGIRASDPGQEE